MLSHLDGDEDVPYARSDTFSLQTTGSRLCAVSTVWHGEDDIETLVTATHHVTPTKISNLVF
jgi:hypothetical protein